MSSATVTLAGPDLEIIPTGAALGAELRGVDLGRVDNAGFAAIHQAWLAHSVLLFRGQSLEPEALIAFSRRRRPMDAPANLSADETAKLQALLDEPSEPLR